jgi:two-component system phosphate regulon sensor histidine kinase PhoR
MKFLYLLAIGWGVVAVLTGFLGSTWLQADYERRETERFARDIQFLANVLAARQWHRPAETDPEWKTAELSYGMRMVPLDAAPRSAERPTLDIDWSRSPLGIQRVSAELALNATAPPGESPAFDAIRFTRELAGSVVKQTWWLGWGITQLAGLVFVMVAIYIENREHKIHEDILSPWVAAVRNDFPRDDFLPRIQSDSKLEPALQLVEERVNMQVNQLRSSHERGELVLSNLQEGVLAIDDRSRVLLANNALQRLLSLTEETYLYRPLLEIVRVPDIDEVAEYVLTNHAPKEILVELEKPTRVVRVLGRPLPLERERFGALLTVRDETVLRRIEAIRRDFVANASHELKTPLAAIRAYAETLQMGALDDREAAEQFVGNIIAQADRINGLVQGMLQLSRVEAGTALKFEFFDACEAVDPCIAAATAMSRTKGITVSATLPEESLPIQSDRDGFQTIASNLLSNAVRYTPEGGHIHVSLAQAGNWFVLRVQDDGIGIHPEDLERIFERFYRAEKDRSQDSGGTGLGLSIVKHLTQALGGSVSASSTPQQGSLFEVRLPLARDPAHNL